MSSRILEYLLAPTWLATVLLTFLLTFSCHPSQRNGTATTLPQEQSKYDKTMANWVGKIEARLAELNRIDSAAKWKATASGRKEDYEEWTAAKLEKKRMLSDRAVFQRLREARAATAAATSHPGSTGDSVLERQIEILYAAYLENQIDPSLLERTVRLSGQIEERFNTYRTEVDGRRLTDNEVEEVLRSSTDQDYRRKVWIASKGIGKTVAQDLVGLVRLRNEAARQLGYSDYFALSLETAFLEEAPLFELLADLAADTEEAYRKEKTALDAVLARGYRIKATDLRPWHYEDRFFQEPPSAGSVTLDDYYRGRDVVDLAARFYDSIGVDTRPVIARSDLYARDGKYQHAYCADLDRQGDVRVMASIVDSPRWMDTILHELGHAIYDIGYSGNKELPYLLRTKAHSLTTEGVAMLMGRLATNPYWMRQFVGIADEEVTKLSAPLRDHTRRGALVFVRWGLALVHFERELYRNPDQDLSSLWWQIVGKYQLLTAPEGRSEPDWAAKIHLTTTPVYYQSYLLGELFAAQLHQTIAEQFFAGQDPWTVVYAGSLDVGRFLDEKVFRPGASLPWEELVVHATGRPLGTSAFVKLYSL
ncbi:MAG: M2 family metallopeptidase [Pseudomonadota bacterium]